jgi:hypothetical protein
LREVKLKVNNPNAHSDTRLVRKIANGNYLVAHESDGFVREYDATGNIVWDYEVPLFGKPRKGGHGPEAFGNSLFSAIRLENGNTLIGGGNGHCVLEVTPQKEIVWKLEQNDLPGITLAWVTRVERLANGNTRFGNCHAGPENPQFIEVTKDKKSSGASRTSKTSATPCPCRRCSKRTSEMRRAMTKTKAFWRSAELRFGAINPPGRAELEFGAPFIPEGCQKVAGG